MLPLCKQKTMRLVCHSLVMVVLIVEQLCFNAKRFQFAAFVCSFLQRVYLLFCVVNIDTIKECTQVTIILLLVMSYALEIIQLFLFELMHLEDEDFPPIFPAVPK